VRRWAWLEVDLAAIAHNLAVIRGLAGHGVAIAPVVKADAYGHGLREVATALAPLSEALCVATLDEALTLRGGVGAGPRIIVLYPVPPDAVADALRADVEITLMSDRDASAALSALAAIPALADVGRSPDRATSEVRVQLAIDTGMTRGGLPPDAVVAVARRLVSDRRISIAGTWTHLCCPEDAGVSGMQSARFEAALRDLESAGIAPGQRHAAASGGIFAAAAPAYDMVRPGLAVYGMLDERLPIAPDARDEAAALRPALAIKARAVAIQEVPAATTVGYGATWRADRASRIATLPVGYGDGYARGSGPGASALVRGRRVPVVGAISMDSLGVDVTDLDSVSGADEFVLLGRQGHESITASDLARARNTIAWEVLSGMAARLERVYHRDAGAEEPVAIAGGPVDSERGH
jgi:alanine racemase